MNSPLRLSICHASESYAYSAAMDCFARLDYIEGLLSLYIPHSETDILNSSRVGRVFKLAGETAECLVLACNISAITDGAVDVCMGDFFLRNKGDSSLGAIENPSRAGFEIDVENYLIKKTAPGRVDLGAIGKGYGVDELAKLLRNPWKIGGAFISFTSSIYALGKNPDGKCWSVNLSDDFSVELPPNSSVGCSGTAVQGNHICDARTGKAVESPPFRVWAFAESAAVSDALSTAFMILPRERVGEICRQYGFRSAIQVSENSPVEWIVG